MRNYIWVYERCRVGRCYGYRNVNLFTVSNMCLVTYLHVNGKCCFPVRMSLFFLCVWVGVAWRKRSESGYVQYYMNLTYSITVSEHRISLKVKNRWSMCVWYISNNGLRQTYIYELHIMCWAYLRMMMVVGQFFTITMIDDDVTMMANCGECWKALIMKDNWARCKKHWTLAMLDFWLTVFINLKSGFLIEILLQV